MKIALKYLAQVRHAAGRGAEALDVADGCSLPELLRRVADGHGEPLRRLLLNASGAPHDSLLLFVGDEQVRGGAVELKDGDVVTVLAPMAGG